MAGPTGSIQGPCEAKWGYTTLSAADWDGDGDPDIVYNSIHGRLGLLRNDAGRLTETPFDTGRVESPPVWYRNFPPSSTTLTQWRTTPLATDWDGDGRLDLVLLDQQGYLTFVGLAVSPNEYSSTNETNRSGWPPAPVAGPAESSWRSSTGTATGGRTCWSTPRTRRGIEIARPATARSCYGRSAIWPAETWPATRRARPFATSTTTASRTCWSAARTAESITSPTTIAKPSRRKKCKPAPAPTPAASKFPGFVAEDLIVPAGRFNESHTATICETSRGLVAAWVAGTAEDKSDRSIWASYHDGLKWNGPTLIADGVQHDGLRYRCWNPVLVQSPGGEVTLLFFKVGTSPKQWWGEMMVSHDRGRTFGDRQRLPEGIVGPVRSKPLLLGDGKTLLCGSSTESDGWRAHFESVELADGLPNSTWHRTKVINDPDKVAAIQPVLLTHPDGRLQAICRTDAGKLASTSSTDQGRSWSAMEATDVPNPNSAVDAVTLADGRHLLVYNPTSTETGSDGRHVLSVAISDDGKTWERVADLESETGAEFCYPAVIQSPDGLVHVVYTWHRRSIKHVVIDPAKLGRR